ncbi:methyl-accepting chemotaxis protein [Parashewanella spongiae]|uniref:Methyl-accepting chemotaxis protein n=2 Tax=Parashewanella spongiae TaxID=342950 RepID=A0A3A6U9R7_9GAMM|nr:methyl-accepting chemotaxis protein [Parashewanella spongiae]
MTNSLSIRALVLTTLATIFLVVLSVTLWFGASSQQEHLESYAQQHSHSLSQSYFDSLNTMMLTGTIANRGLLRDKMTADKSVKDIRVIRSDELNKVFGQGLASESVRDELDKKALSGQEINIIKSTQEGRVFTQIKPVRATSNYQGVNCLGCHQVSENTILGAIRVDYSLAEDDKKLHNSLLKSAAIQISFFILAFVATAYILNKLVISRLRQLRHTMNNIADNADLTLQLDVTRNDEIGTLSSTFNRMISQINLTLCTVVDNAKQVTESAKEIASMSETTKHEVLIQKSSTAQVATAITEMAASAEQVRCNSNTTAEQSQITNSTVSNGEQQAKAAVCAIEHLQMEVQQGATRIRQLDHRTDEVAAVLSVISGIAEQTNLLALNAAIEAARAGEQGRGFAVVADEVRTLASRTQDSTKDIRDTIEGLKTEASDCVSIMDRASELAEKQVVSIQSVAGELQHISKSINDICELNSQMEVAASEQSLVAESVNANVIDISQSAESTSKDAEQTAFIANKLLEMASQLGESANQFKLHS